MVLVGLFQRGKQRNVRIALVAVALWGIGGCRSAAPAPTPLDPLDPLGPPNGPILCRTLPLTQRDSAGTASVSIRVNENEGKQREFDASFDSLGAPIYLTVKVSEPTAADSLRGQILVFAFGKANDAVGIRYVTDSASVATMMQGGSQPPGEPLSPETIARGRGLGEWLSARGCHRAGREKRP